MIRVEADAAGLAQAVDILRDGGIVAYPTETVYGLAVDPFNEPAVQRLIEAKGRGADQAILLIISEQTQLPRCAAAINPAAERCMEAFWPGPLTLLFPKAPGLAPSLTGERDTIAVRCPAHETARALCAAFSGPVTSTSANRSGQSPAMAPGELDVPGVDLFIDGGTLPPSKPSTLYDPVAGRILREGAVTAEDIARRLRG